jgi:hypothetical protein
MRPLSLIGVTAAAAAFMCLASCDNPPSKTGPTPLQSTVRSIEVTGPASIAPSQSAQFVASMRLQDDTVKSATAAQNLRWRIGNTQFATVTQSGVVTASANFRGETTVIAEILPNGAIRSTREVVILPDGTYRLVGTVVEADAPTSRVAGARVEVVGTSVFTLTDNNGQYRLYGVPAQAEIRVSLSGYLTSVESVQLSAHSTKTFALQLSGPRVSLNGPYLLTIEAGTCQGSSTLAASLRIRTYEAMVTTSGSRVEVLLTEDRFRINAEGRGNRLIGTAQGGGVNFQLDPWYYYYYYSYYPHLAERLPDGTFLVIYGTAVTSGNASSLVGTMNGSLSQYDNRFPSFSARFLGGCFSTGHQFRLTPR